MEKKRALKVLGILIAIELAVVALFVWFFDPFYQYHEPFMGLQAVLNDRDNQMPGSLRNFTYDSVLLGSSVAENFDSSYLDEVYDCHTIKAIRASGSVADLLYYMDMARENREIKRVFWCLDIFALLSSPEVTLYEDNIPRYLHTTTVVDDIPYLYNKEIILEKTPIMLASSQMGMNTGGHAYDWSEDKEFSAERAMEAYEKPEEILPPIDYSQDIPMIQKNVEMVLQEINAHPDVEYIVFFPPYSMLWWDCGHINGFGEEYLYVVEQILTGLVDCENVTVYYYQAEQDIICNLDYYMDMVHYSPEINQYMLESIAADKGRVTTENLTEVLTHLRETYEYIITEGIYQYYEKY